MVETKQWKMWRAQAQNIHVGICDVYETELYSRLDVKRNRELDQCTCWTECIHALGGKKREKKWKTVEKILELFFQYLPIHYLNIERQYTTNNKFLFFRNRLRDWNNSGICTCWNRAYSFRLRFIGGNRRPQPFQSKTLKLELLLFCSVFIFLRNWECVGDGQWAVVIVTIYISTCHAHRSCLSLSWSLRRNCK